jgi:hypothetical protein
MKLFKLSRTDDIHKGEYEACIVAAKDEAKARLFHPSEHTLYIWDGSHWVMECNRTAKDSSAWPAPDQIEVQLIGNATDKKFTGVILSSYLGD